MNSASACFLSSGNGVAAGACAAAKASVQNRARRSDGVIVWRVGCGAAHSRATMGCMEPPRFAMRLPAHVLNGLAVSLGISLIQVTLVLTAGKLAALAAAT